MKLEILQPDRSVYQGTAASVTVPGSDGLIGILDHHAPLIASLKKGKVKVTDEQSNDQYFDINGGIVEVLNNEVIVLAD